MKDEITKYKEQIEKLQKENRIQLQINNDNSFLTDFSFQLANLSDKDFIKDIALPQIKEYTGASYAHFAIYDTKQKGILIQHIETDTTLLNMIIKVVGNKVFETIIPVSEEAYKEITTQNLYISYSLTELSFGAISPLIDKALRKATGFYHFYGITQINSGNLYGITLLVFKKNDTLPSADLLKMYSNLLAVSLKRKQAEDALKESEEKYRILSDNALDGVSLLEDNRITYISDGYLKMLGYGKEDMLGISFEDILNLTHKDDLDILRETITNAYKNQTKQHSYECRIRTITGKYIWIENRTRIEYYENGKHKRSIIHTRDITDRKEAEIQKNYLSAIIENTENICVVKDLDLRVIATNESFAKAAGKKSVKDLIGKTDAEIFEVSPDQKPIKGYMKDELKAQKLKKGEKVLREENIIYPDKSIKTVLTTKFPVYDSNNKLIATANISTDITERKQAELAIKESEKRYKELFDNLIDEVHVWNIVKDENGEIKTWKLSDINPSALKAWGKTKNEVIGKTTDEIFKDNSTENFMPIIKKIFTSGKPHSWESYFPPTNQFLSMTSIPLGNRFISTGSDVTKEKAADEALKESEERYSMIFERTKNPIVITNLEGYIVQFNKAAYKQLDYTKEEYGKLHISQIDVNDKPEEVAERMEEIKKEGAVFFETQHRTKSGQILDIMVSAAIIKIKNEPHNLVVFNDITPIKQAHKRIVEQNKLLEEQDEKLKQTLETKDVLLKEVHHRVKNNLQTVSSLLYQQKTLSKDPKIALALNDSMSRVSSMALIHQYIYKSNDLKNINIKQYISELVSKLKESYQKQQQNIQLQMEIDDIEFDIDKTIPVALMMNEILSNIFKYAFRDNETGKINISLKNQDAAKVKLIVSDNGIGFPENFDAEKSKSLGMYLIVNFAKLQLAGDLTVSSKPNEGVKYEIIF